MLGPHSPRHPPGPSASLSHSTTRFQAQEIKGLQTPVYRALWAKAS